MKFSGLITSLLLLTTAASAQSTFISLETSKGDILVKLYDKTPLHRDNMVSGIRKGWWKSALFNRVIKDFVSQAGELDDPILEREKQHPDRKPERLKSELFPELYHFKGALGAGRDDNAQKASFLNQIYLVTGKKQTDIQLDEIESKKGFKYTPEQRETYKSKGGIPRLDGDYTIFGEIVKGMEVADEINQVKTDKHDLPEVPVVINARVLTAKAAAKLLN